MKVINFAAAAALMMLVAPVLLCSCNSTPAKKETKQEVRTPKTAADEPKPVEITSESSFAQEVPAQAEPAKAEVAKAPEAPARAEVAKAPEAPAREETVKAPKAPAKSEKPRVKSAQAKLPCEHTVRTGDNLWNISRRYYGSGKNWKKIYEANKSQIRKPEFLEPGTVLKIPAK